MAKCPRCSKENRTPAREWVGGNRRSKSMKVQRFVCASCGTSYVAWADSKKGIVETMVRKG